MSIVPQKVQSLTERAVLLTIHMYLLEFIVRKINNKTNFNQRDQYKN